MVAWVGDDFPSPLECVLSRFEGGCAGRWLLHGRSVVLLASAVADVTPPCSTNEPDDRDLWAQVICLCYTSRGIARVLGCVECNVAGEVESLRLLAVTTSDGVILYPAFQLSDGQILEGLNEALQILRTAPPAGGRGRSG